MLKLLFYTGLSGCLCSAGLLRDINLSLPIHWDLSNSVFFKSSTSPPEISVSLGDKVNVLCPSQKNSKHYQYSTNLPPIFQIQMVDKKTFETCSSKNQKISKSSIRKTIYSCDQPFDQKKLTLHFLQVSPIYDAPTFNPGQTYYFVTSKQDLCEEGLKLKVHVTVGEDNGIARLEEVTMAPNYDIFTKESWTVHQLLILAASILALLSLLTCTIHLIVRKQATGKTRRQSDNEQQNSSRFDKDGTTVSTGSSTNGATQVSLHSDSSKYNPHQITSQYQSQLHSQLNSQLQTQLQSHLGSSTNNFNNSAGFNTPTNFQHNTYSAFTPYRQSVGNSLTILQTSPPWVVDLNTGEDLLAPKIAKTSPVRMVDVNFYTQNQKSLVKTLPENLEETKLLNKSGNMVVEI